MQSISIFGATGSIGGSALDIVRSHPDRFSVYALSAFKQIKKLQKLALEFAAKVVIVPNESARREFIDLWSDAGKSQMPEIRVGAQALQATARDEDASIIICAIVGTSGLASAYAAACAGKRILLSNKEALVAAGQLFMSAVKDNNATLLPLDSEHNAIFQCLPKPAKNEEIKNVILTASGGPFRDMTLEQLQRVTPEQACKHPNWSMGRKISVDSATMLNKGLEVIEAKWLFDLPLSKINVLIHRQSVIHSLVQFCDGSILAQMGHADMRIPISYAMGYPDRITNNAESFELEQFTRLDFTLPDLNSYPCLKLSYQAMESGQSYCLVLNAANEVAVAAFLKGQIAYPRIPELIEQMLSENWQHTANNIDDILAFDAQVRVRAQTLIS